MFIRFIPVVRPPCQIGNFGKKKNLPYKKLELKISQQLILTPALSLARSK